MRNRRQTIESLKRLAERPGTKAEGETARRLLEAMIGNQPQARAFNPADFPWGTEVWYSYWCYRNQHGVIVSQKTLIEQGETWLRIKFDYLKQARWVPVTSRHGCHISKQPFPPQEEEYLYSECWMGH